MQEAGWESRRVILGVFTDEDGFPDGPLPEIVGVAMDVVVNRIAFDGFASCFHDQLLYAIDGQELRGCGTCVVVDEFMADRTINIIRTVSQGGLGSFDTQHDPIGFDVRDIVEHQTGDGQGSEIHEGRGLFEVIEPGILGVEGERDKGLKAAGLILQVA